MMLGVLGPLEIYQRDHQPVRVTGHKQRLLLAILGLRAGEWISTQRLATLLWGDEPPASSAANLKTYMWELRRVLPEPAGGGRRIESRRGEYRLAADRAEVDLLRFEDLLADGRKALTAGDLAAAVEDLTQATRLWRGEPLENVALPATLVAEQSRLDEQRWSAIEDLHEARLALGQHAEVVADIGQAVARQPLRERLWGQLMIALYRCGRRAEALDAFGELRRRLDEELGIRPGPAVAELHQLVLRDDPWLAVPATHDDAPAATVPPECLPPDLTSFAGRDTEIRAIVALAARQNGSVKAGAVISAIDGMAGIGKTTLAVHVAHRLAPRYPDGQLFVDLHGFTDGIDPTDPHDAIFRLLRQLGLPAESIPPDPEDRVALYRRRLAGTRTLILLDNVATEDQVRPLLPSVPGCFVLITSRRRLIEIDDLQPLPLDVLPSTDGVTLFHEIVGATRSAQEPGMAEEVVSLCDGLPLAIRIAGARLRARPTWSLAYLADRLRDSRYRLAELETGQRSVAAAVQVSYKVVTGEQQRLFRLLGLHVGSHIDTYAAAALADIDLRDADRLLEALVDANLLQSDGPGRYHLHDLVRHHAAHLAEQQEPEQYRRDATLRLFDYWLVAAAGANDVLSPHRPVEITFTHRPPHIPELRTLEQVQDWFEAQRPNLLLAIAYSGRHGMDTHTWQLSFAIRNLLRTQGYVDDMLTTQQAALTASAGQGDSAFRAELLATIGLGQWYLGNSERTIDSFDRALRMFRAIGHQRGEARVLTTMGLVYWRLGRYQDALDCRTAADDLAAELDDQAVWLDAIHLLGLTYWRLGRYRDVLELHRHALAVADEIGSPRDEAELLNANGLATVRLGRYDTILVDQQRALAIHREHGNLAGQIHTRNIMGMALIRMGRPGEAQEHQKHALAISRQISDRWGEAHTLNIIGLATADLGDPVTALGTFEQALGIVRRTGDPALECDILNGLGAAYLALEKHDEAVEAHRQALGIAARIGERYEEARAHTGLAAALEPDPDAAAHRAAAARLREELGVPSA
jgi:DNA-binding SARP family transcriptional activator